MHADSQLKGETDLSGCVIGAAYRVANALGTGFLEKVYENALAIELRLAGHEVRQQYPVEVRYRKQIVGIYQADLLVDGRVVVELKAVDALSSSHRAQCINYLRATGLRTGLLINFGHPRIVIRRILA